jgi:hypothetical protein
MSTSRMTLAGQLFDNEGKEVRPMEPVPEDLGGFIEAPRLSALKAELAALAQRVEACEAALDALRARLDANDAPTR